MNGVEIPDFIFGDKKFVLAAAGCCSVMLSSVCYIVCLVGCLGGWGFGSWKVCIVRSFRWRYLLMVMEEFRCSGGGSGGGLVDGGGLLGVVVVNLHFLVVVDGMMAATQSDHKCFSLYRWLLAVSTELDALLFKWTNV
ncbi:hypothetical protein A2U01_0005173 [Trifolium medium]|uniref:Transmembrane protein n=1 Tax=Trifolium medium TaxID=97028 RepID=A0A392MAN6_9FABA|nr:hypothetical protein [Trifolium medium]